MTWDIDYVAILARVKRIAPRVFLSYHREDKQIARLLATRLAARGIGTWLDEAEIKLGDTLMERIQRAIEEVEYVAVLISKHSLASSWVAKELEIAINRELDTKSVKVLPVLLDDSTLPEFLNRKMHADLRSPDNLEKVVAAIEARLQE